LFNEEAAHHGEAFGFRDECVDLVRFMLPAQRRGGALMRGSVVVSVFAIVILSVIGALFKVC